MSRGGGRRDGRPQRQPTNILVSKTDPQKAAHRQNRLSSDMTPDLLRYRIDGQKEGREKGERISCDSPFTILLYDICEC